MEQKHDDKIMGDKERLDELAKRPGKRRAGDEVEEAVQSEEEKDEPRRTRATGAVIFILVSINCLITLTSI